MYAQDPTQMSMNWTEECAPLTARMWKDAYPVYHTEMEDDDRIRPEECREVRGGAVLTETCLTQDANQYKEAKCVVQYVREGGPRVREIRGGAA